MIQLKVLILLACFQLYGNSFILAHIIASAPGEPDSSNIEYILPPIQRTPQPISKVHYTGLIKDQSDFEKTAFFSYYNLKKDRGENLNNGNSLYPYRIPSQLSTKLYLQVHNKRLESIQLQFTGGNKNIEADLTLVSDLLHSIDPQMSSKLPIEEFIKSNIVISKTMIRHGKSLRIGQFNIYAGNISNLPTIWIKKIN